MRVLAPMLVVALAALAGCAGATHLSPEFGRSFRATFAAQPLNKDTVKTGSLGLDSQEATAVSASYRAGLVPKEVSSEAPPLLLVSPQAQRKSMLPPPSVPQQ